MTEKDSSASEVPPILYNIIIIRILMIIWQNYPTFAVYFLKFVFKKHLQWLQPVPVGQ